MESKKKEDYKWTVEAGLIENCAKSSSSWSWMQSAMVKPSQFVITSASISLQSWLRLGSCDGFDQTITVAEEVDAALCKAMR